MLDSKDFQFHISKEEYYDETCSDPVSIPQDVSEKRIPIMLCANKVDLRPEASANGRKCVSVDEGERMAREHSAIFIETSAKEGNNVIDALVQLSRCINGSRKEPDQTNHYALPFHQCSEGRVFIYTFVCDYSRTVWGTGPIDARTRE